MRRQPSQNEQQPEVETVSRLNELLRVVRQREENYFKVIDFIKRNIDTIGRHMEQLTIVHRFLGTTDTDEAELVRQEQVLIDQPSSTAPHCRKLIGRMVVRLFELFEVSLNRVRGTYFCNERHESDYNSFKAHLNKSVAQEVLHFAPVAQAVLSYSRAKYSAEVDRLRRYLHKIEHGADIEMKRYYMGTADEFDSDRSPDRNQRDSSLKKKNSDSRKQSKDSNRQKKDQTKFTRSSEKEDSPMAGRTSTVGKVMKLYNVLDPSRTQFLEDMIYTESEEAHRSRLLNSLWEKNKAIDDQIRQYHKKVVFVADKIKALKQPQPKSDCQASDHNSAERSRSNMFRSEASIKPNNFVISKPKKQNARRSKRDLLEENVGEHTDFVVNSAGEYSSGAEYASDTGGHVPNTERTYIKQDATRRPVSKALLKRKGFPNLGSRPASRDGSKEPFESEPTKQMKSRSSSKNNRIFIIKSPTLFEDQNLQSKMVVGPNTGTILNKKQSEINTSKLRPRPSNKRMSKSVLVRDESTIHPTPRHEKQQQPDRNQRIERPSIEPVVKSIFNEKPPLLDDRIIFDSERIRQFGARKQFNLRLKKHMKKNILVSDRLFIEQTNQQINSYNF